MRKYKTLVKSGKNSASCEVLIKHGPYKMVWFNAA